MYYLNKYVVIYIAYTPNATINIHLKVYSQQNQPTQNRYSLFVRLHFSE